MSELEISNVKYQALKKWQTLGNKAEGVEQLLKILPTYESLVNTAVQIRHLGKSQNNANRPFFTDESGKAIQAVRSMQQNTAYEKLQEDYER